MRHERKVFNSFQRLKTTKNLIKIFYHELIISLKYEAVEKV